MSRKRSNAAKSRGEMGRGSEGSPLVRETQVTGDSRWLKKFCRSSLDSPNPRSGKNYYTKSNDC